MASFLSLNDDRLKLMPLRPPTISLEFDPRSNVHHGGYTIKCLHPFLFPMVLGRIFAVERNKFMKDSWQERHFRHCQFIVQEITRCEFKMKSLLTKTRENNLSVKMIEEIDNDDDTSFLDSSVTESSHMPAFTNINNSQLKSSMDTPPRDPILVEIPTNILGSVIAPLIRDRYTFDNLAATCWELRQTCMSMDPPPPWPEGHVRLGSGIWYVSF
jgi:hypothetical protein